MAKRPVAKRAFGRDGGEGEAGKKRKAWTLTRSVPAPQKHSDTKEKGGNNIKKRKR